MICPLMRTKARALKEAVPINTPAREIKKQTVKKPAPPPVDKPAEFVRENIPNETILESTNRLEEALPRWDGETAPSGLQGEPHPEKDGSPATELLSGAHAAL